jgi:hypothetical protein
MYMISYAVLVKIGPYEFAKGFQTEIEAIRCFDALSASQDGVAQNGTLTMPSGAVVDNVTLRRYKDNIDRISDPADPRMKPSKALGQP